MAKEKNIDPALKKLAISPEPKIVKALFKIEKKEQFFSFILYPVSNQKQNQRQHVFEHEMKNFVSLNYPTLQVKQFYSNVGMLLLEGNASELLDFAKRPEVISAKLQ